MGATTQIRPMPGSRQTTGAAAFGFAAWGAPSLHYDLGETFKKSRCAADLQRGGRHLAKDLTEAPIVQLPMTILRNLGIRSGDHSAVAIPAASSTFDGKLTAAEPAACTTRVGLPQTEERAGAFWMDVRRVCTTAPELAREIECDAEV